VHAVAQYAQLFRLFLCRLHQIIEFLRQRLLPRAMRRRDRRTAMIVVAVMAVVMGLIIWLASMSGGSLPEEGINYWQIMP